MGKSKTKTNAKAAAVPTDFSTMGVLDIIRLWQSGLVKEAIEAFNSFKTRDVEIIAKELGDVLGVLKLPQFQEQVNKLAKTIKSGDPAAIGDEGFLLASMVCREFRKDLANAGIAQTMLDTIPIPPLLKKNGEPVVTHADAKRWLNGNRQALRDVTITKNLFGRVFINRNPEVKDILSGKPMGVLNPEQLANLIEILRWAAKIAAGLSIVWPPAMLIAQALNLIIAYYDSRHPVNGTGADIGLELTDFE